MVQYNYDHLHFKCSDPDVTAKFYIDNFGGTHLFSRVLRGAPMVAVKVGGQTLLLSGKGEEEKIEGDSSVLRYGLDHWGLVVDDLDAAFTELTANGVKFVMEPTVLNSTTRIAFVTSPDNARIELVERK